jgi:hypothetical protein
MTKMRRKMKKNRTKIIVMTLILAGTFAGLTSLTRPEILPANGPETAYSAERALEHVTVISQAPHPPGSEELEKVRTYIFAELEKLGLSPEVQEATVANPRSTRVEASTIKNIVAKIPGSNSSKAILLDAHYDTRAMTPGASDCGSCVATLLETARALLVGPPLQNDVILLFTDNEEYGGGLGAIAFIENHPWAQEIGMVLNFEGLGSSGPSLLFETGPNSGWMVKEMGQVVSHPVGQSWFYEIYRLTPIGTDLTWFSKEGISGMNFGYWAKGTAYHSMLDNPQTIDLRSLQHHGSYALALTQQFGNQDLNETRTSTGDAVYFSLFPGMLISYPSGWALPLAILAGLLLVGISIVGNRSKQVTIWGALKGTWVFLLSLLASSILATGIWMGAVQLHKEYQAMLTFRGMVYNAHFYLFAFIALAIAIETALVVKFRRKTSVMDLFFGALLFLWLMAFVTSILMPGFSYLFTWPLMFSALSLAWIIWQNAHSRKFQQPEILLTIGALPGIIIFAPSIYVMFHFALAPMIGILAFLVNLLLGLLIPQLDMLTREREWRLSKLALVVCVAFLVTGSLSASFSEEQIGPNAVAYLLDADSGKATWFSGGSIQDDWSAQFFSTEPEHGVVGELFPIPQSSRFPIMQGEARAATLDAPVVEVLSDQTTGDLRTIQLQLSSPRQAPVIRLDVEPYAAVQALIIHGKRIEPIESEVDLWSLTYYAVPSEGFEVTLEVVQSQPIIIQVSDQTWELVPEVVDQLGLAIQPRPEDMMPMPNFDYGTVVVKVLPIH